MLIGLYSRGDASLPFLSFREKALIREIKSQGHGLILFSASGIEEEPGRISGWDENEQGQPVRIQLPYPDVVIPIGLHSGEPALEAELRLRERVPFTTPSFQAGPERIRKLNRRRSRRGAGLLIPRNQGMNAPLYRVHLHRNRNGRWAVLGINAEDDWQTYSGGHGPPQKEGLAERACELAEAFNEMFAFLIDELILELDSQESDQPIRLVDVAVGDQGWVGEEERAAYSIDFAAYLAELCSVRQKDVVPLVALLSAGDRKEALLREACALVAAGYGARFYHLNPSDFGGTSPLVKGTLLREGRWESGYFPRPDVVYDRLKERGNPTFAPLYAWLQGIPSTEDRFGGTFSKLKMYQVLSRDPETGRHLLPYEAVTEADKALLAIDAYGSAVIKPDTGSFGDRLLFVEASGSGEHYVLKDHHHFHRLSREQLMGLLGSLVSQGKPYLIQRFVDSSTPQGFVFFIRMHLVKDRVGAWRVVSPIVYLSTHPYHKNANHRSNFWVYSLLEPFLRHHFQDNQKEIKEALTSASIQLARHLEGTLTDRFNEVGIDFGLDHEGNSWIFEANLNKVGVRFRELEIAKLIIPTALSLVARNREKE